MSSPAFDKDCFAFRFDELVYKLEQLAEPYVDNEKMEMPESIQEKIQAAFTTIGEFLTENQAALKANQVTMREIYNDVELKENAMINMGIDDPVMRLEHLLEMLEPELADIMSKEDV